MVFAHVTYSLHYYNTFNENIDYHNIQGFFSYHFQQRCHLKIFYALAFIDQYTSAISNHCTLMHHRLYCVVCEIFTIHVKCMKTASLKLLPFMILILYYCTNCCYICCAQMLTIGGGSYYEVLGLVQKC